MSFLDNTAQLIAIGSVGAGFLWKFASIQRQIENKIAKEKAATFKEINELKLKVERLSGKIDNCNQADVSGIRISEQRHQLMANQVVEVKSEVRQIREFLIAKYNFKARKGIYDDKQGG